ncbi:hypothetical protein NliqN6_3445 [Naganishia liquefaciens]|uniref:Cytochrome b561 domain-containing protein n=1 Tax=Naganishia liquefaciens TaxID=104408 RepID=A0A8H3TTX6_9TREE|nr:hypothetical protein NliqN6_3445 [Naganishia liquefaciens]
MMRLLPLLLLLCAPLALASHSASWCNRVFCIHATHDDAPLVRYEVEARVPVGWIGVGSGYKMRGSRMVVLWRGQEGCIISERDGHGHLPPELNHAGTTALVSGNSSTSSFLSCTYTQPSIGVPEVPIGMLWAYSTTPPILDVNGRAEDAKIRMHEEHGIFDLVFYADGSPGVENQGNGSASAGIAVSSETAAKRQKVIRAHAAFMTIGWMITAPLAVLIARFGRGTKVWLPSHRGIQFGTLGVALAGIGCAIAGNRMRGGRHFKDAHAILGLILVVLLLIQLSLGLWIHHRYDPLRTHRPPRNFIHIALGVTLLIGGIANEKVGIGKWGDEKWMVVTFWAWTGLLIGSFALGLSLLPRQLRKEAKDARSRNPSIRLSRIQASFPAKDTLFKSPFTPSPATTTPGTAAGLVVQYPWGRNARAVAEPYRDAATPVPFKDVPLGGNAGRDLVAPGGGKEVW